MCRVFGCRPEAGGHHLPHAETPAHCGTAGDLFLRGHALHGVRIVSTDTGPLLLARHSSIAHRGRSQWQTHRDQQFPAIARTNAGQVSSYIASLPLFLYLWRHPDHSMVQCSEGRCRTIVPDAILTALGFALVRCAVDRLAWVI